MPVLVAVELDQSSERREEGQGEEQVDKGQELGDDVVDPGEDIGQWNRKASDDLGVDQTSLGINRCVIIVCKVPGVDTQHNLTKDHSISIVSGSCSSSFSSYLCEKLDETRVEVNASKRELGTYRCTARLGDVETSREQCKGAGLHLSRVVARHLVTKVLIFDWF